MTIYDDGFSVNPPNTPPEQWEPSNDDPSFPGMDGELSPMGEEGGMWVDYPNAPPPTEHGSHYENLAEVLDENQLRKIASGLSLRFSF